MTVCICVFNAEKKCIKVKDEESTQLSAEQNPCGRKASKDFFNSNEVVHASEKAQNTPVKKCIATDTVMTNTDAIIVAKQKFTASYSSPGTPSEVSQLTGDTVGLTREETALNKQHFNEPATSGGSNSDRNRDNVTDELPQMSSNAVLGSKCQCRVCDRKFQYECRLKRHMEIHTRDKLYSCTFCDKRLRTKYEHKMHELCHKGQLPQCPVCGGRYVALEKHLLIHSTDSYKHVCFVCKKAFRQASNLKSHMLVHTDVKAYTCQDCGREYKTSTYLKLHIRSAHLQQKNHVCSFCGKRFAHRVSLKAHIPVHTDEKPYHCETCDKSFKTRANLAAHQTVHSSEKHFICSTCGKCFRRDCALKRHNLIHSGEQPYECSMCKMRFNQSCSMQRHMLTHTGEQPYSCSDCGTRFTQSGGLASHRLRHCPNLKNSHS